MPKYIPERPEIVKSTILENDLSIYRSRFKVNGDSPLITDHLSNRTYRIVKGGGSLLIADLVEVEFQKGVEIFIPHGEQFNYSGKFTAELETYPGLIPEFITYGNDSLSRSQRRFVHKVWAETLIQRTQRRLANSLNIPDTIALLSQIDEARNLSETQQSFAVS